MRDGLAITFLLQLASKACCNFAASSFFIGITARITR